MVARLAALSAGLAILAQAAPQDVEVSVDAKAPGPVIKITPATRYQPWDGTGVSEAFQRSLVLHELNTKSQNLALDLMFSNVTGAGFTILRNGLGSDTTQPFDLMKSIAPVPPASNSSELNYIPLPRGDQYQVWLSKQAIARGVYTIYADAWSADPYMKTNNMTNNGGLLCGVTNTSCPTGDWRQSYADKIVRYIKDYRREGITIDYVGFLNEPDLTTPYASMNSDGQQAADFIEVLYPTLKAAGLSTQIACCDGSGWEQQRSRLQGIQAAGVEDMLGVVTAHGYSSRPSTPFQTSKRVWETEWSTFDAVNFNWWSGYSATDRRGQGDGLTWANHAQQTIAVSNVTGFFYWWGAANTTDNQSLLIVNNTNTVQVTKRLWAFAHWGSRLVLPGAYRIDATTTLNTTAVTAFSNPDGSTAVQVINNGNATQTVTIKGIKVPMQQNAVVTFLTNQQIDFEQGVPISQDKNLIVANVPAKSLLSFRVPAMQ